MKKQRFLFALFMAIVMMAMSPGKAWGQNYLVVDGYEYEFNENGEVTLDLTAGQRIWVELDASNYGRVNCTPSTIEHINGSNMSVSVKDSYDKPIMVGIPGKYTFKISNVNVNVQAEDIYIWVPEYETDPETGQDYESGGQNVYQDTNYTLKEASATLSITCLSAEEEHQHVYNQEEKNIEGARITAETCTEKGIYKKSCICGALGTETFEVNALGHLMVNSGNTIAVPATCTENARKFQTCDRCDYESDTETFESFGTKLGHNYIDGVCQNCGESETQGPIIMTCLAGTSGIGFGEGAASLIDGDDYTKWCSYWNAANKPYIIFKTNVRAKLTGYYMVHGNDTPDYPDRAWATWTIYGANFDSDSQATAESTAWKEVDKHSGYSYGSDYSFSNLTSLQYQYYKIVVDEVPNNNLQQMAEIHFTFFACNHKGTFTEHPATEATAEAHGNVAYKTCDICGSCLDADGQEITTSVIHYFDEEHTHAAKDPSCTQVGNIAYKECAVCQAIFDMDDNPIDSYEVPMSDHSYDSEGKCTTCGQELPLLSLGSNTIDIEKGYTIFYFIAPQDATYFFETTGDEDTYGAILSTDGETIINEDDDSGNGQNFRLSYEMSAGSIVMLGVRKYDNNAIPGYTLVIRIHNHEWRDGVCAECYKICDHSDMENLGHSDATCTQPAGTSYKCNNCSFAEFTPDEESSALGHNVVDGVCTRCEKPMAIAVTIGSDTHQFVDFDEALPVALDVLSATVTLLTDVTLPKDKDLFFDRGNITLDLNGKKISGNGIRIVYLLGGNLTITDNTADKKGVIENTTNGGDGISSAVVWVDKGALIIHAGTFCSKSELALYANQHNQEIISVTIDGGRFVSLEGEAAISTVFKPSLAEGYAYYKTGTDEEIEEQLDTPISEYDITVLPMSIKATVTAGETTTEYNTFKAAFYAASTETSATLKLQKDYKLATSQYIEFEDGDVTLDLNGKTIISNNGYSTLIIKGGKLTIDDSSTDKTGRMINVGKTVLKVEDGGTLVVREGLFLASEYGYAVSANNESTVSLYGGRYVAPENAILKLNNSSILADGYGFFQTETNAELTSYDGEGNLLDSDNSKAKDVIVRKPITSNEITLAVNDEEQHPVVITKGVDEKFTTNQVVDFTDVTNLSTPVDFVANNGVTYDRNLTALTGSDWGTLCLPFDIPYNASTDATFYTLTSVSNESVTLTAVTSGTIEAGTPLLFKKGSEATSLGISTNTATAIKTGAAAKSAADGGALQLKGTFVPKYVKTGYYLDSADGMLHSIEVWSNFNNALLTIPAYRAWFEGSVSNGNEAKALNIVIDDEETTAIDALNAFIQGKADIYGLDGQKRSDLQKGINIVNGKKILVK